MKSLSFTNLSFKLCRLLKKTTFLLHPHPAVRQGSLKKKNNNRAVSLNHLHLRGSRKSERSLDSLKAGLHVAQVCFQHDFLLVLSFQTSNAVDSYVCVEFRSRRPRQRLRFLCSASSYTASLPTKDTGWIGLNCYNCYKIWSWKCSICWRRALLCSYKYSACKLRREIFRKERERAALLTGRSFNSVSRIDSCARLDTPAQSLTKKWKKLL